jgi:hypothetical protein
MGLLAVAAIGGFLLIAFARRRRHEAPAGHAGLPVVSVANLPPVIRLDDPLLVALLESSHSHEAAASPSAWVSRLERKIGPFVPPPPGERDATT